jgi:hypothetical protein
MKENRHPRSRSYVLAWTILRVDGTAACVALNHRDTETQRNTEKGRETQMNADKKGLTPMG